MRPSIRGLALAGVFACATSGAVAACGGSNFAAGGDDGGAQEASVSDAPSPSPDAAEAGAGDAGPRRSFALAAGGMQLLVTGPSLGFQITPANLADDVDVIEVHQEFYGVPWVAFGSGSAPPAEWKAVMDGIAASARSAGKPVFLSVTMLNGGRRSVAARTVVQSGSVQSQDGWATDCYDFATAPDGAAMKQAYLAYVAWMIDEFSPRWLNVAVEVNLFFEHCPGAIAGVVDVANAAYDAAKTKGAGLVVFPSIQIDHLYGYAAESCPDPSQRDACFAANYAQVAPLKRDRFAMSTYPMLGAIGSPANLPPDWFIRGAARGGERPLVAETGWNSTPIVVDLKTGACATVLSSTEADAASYLGLLLAAAKSANMDLVNWWSDRDLVVSKLMTDCPCSFDATWCAVLDAFRGPAPDGGDAGDPQAFGELGLKGFGTMGLRAYDGAPKPSLSTEWQAVRATPWGP